MQKYENHIHDFLLQEKIISLQGIGTIEVKDDSEQVNFIYDKRAVTTAAFIQFVAERTGKNSVLVGYDVESHLEQARQFINIGKPYTIPGFGNIYITRTGEYRFEARLTPHAHETIEEPVTVYQSAETEEKERKKRGLLWLAIVVVALLVGAGGYGIYQMLNNRSGDAAALAEEAPADTVALPPAADTAQSRAPQNDSSVALGAGDTARFRFIIEQTFNPRRAYRRSGQLTTLKVPIYLDSVRVGDSTLYRLYFIKRATIADTARIKDSLRIWYASRRVVAEVIR